MSDQNAKLWKQLKEIGGIDVKPILVAGARVIEMGSRLRAPVRTGFMKNSHDVKDHPQGVAIHVEADYASFVEFGTRNMQAQPFLRPAIDEDMGEAERVMGERLTQEVRVLASKVGVVR